MARPDEELQSILDGKWAITWSKEEGFQLVTPQMDNPNTDDHQVPDEGVAMTGCMIRLDREPEFRQEMVDWFYEEVKKAS